MSDVTDITGIGPAKAETLAEAGYKSVDEIADADRDELAAVDGVGEDRALEFIVGAADLIGDESEDESDEGEAFDLTPAEIADEVEEDEEEVEEVVEVVEEEPDEAPESEEPESYTVTLDFNNRMQYHTFHAAIMRYHENIYTSNQPYANTMQKILDGLTDFDGVTYELDEQEINTLHTAVKQSRTDYQGNNRIDHMDQLAVVEEQVDSQRREYLF